MPYWEISSTYRSQKGIEFVAFYKDVVLLKESVIVRDMDLKVIGSHANFRISQSLGKGSSGCRLNPGALAECSAFLQNEISRGCDLLVLNRFGKGESEGRGFRDLISLALANNIPVLTAVRPAYKVSFEEFAGEFGLVIPFGKASSDMCCMEPVPANISSAPEFNLAV